MDPEITESLNKGLCPSTGQNRRKHTAMRRFLLSGRPLLFPCEAEGRILNHINLTAAPFVACEAEGRKYN